MSKKMQNSEKFGLPSRQKSCRLSHPPEPGGSQTIYTKQGDTGMNILDTIGKEQMKDVTPFNVGDTVKVHCRVIEGGKERVQIFQGIVIGKRGAGINEAFTVRKIAYGEGVERSFPIHTPKIAKIEVVTRGKVRRAKLHYLRDRVGKEAVTVKTIR